MVIDLLKGHAPAITLAEQSGPVLDKRLDLKLDGLHTSQHFAVDLDHHCSVLLECCALVHPV